MSAIKHSNETIQVIKFAKYSVSFLWIFTGLTSIYFSPDIGYGILADAGIKGLLADISVYSGAILDIALGIWFLTSFKQQLCCMVQITIIVIYTLLLTFIDPSYWLHPFGPITKNIPIVFLIYIIRLNKAR